MDTPVWQSKVRNNVDEAIASLYKGNFKAYINMGSVSDSIIESVAQVVIKQLEQEGYMGEYKCDDAGPTRGTSQYIVIEFAPNHPSIANFKLFEDEKK